MSKFIYNNIKTLKRYGAVNLQDNLTYTYNGNKLTALAGTTNANYTYDANGNMNYDGRKNIGINYNLLNLPYQVTKNDTLKATYTYLADGTKLSAKKDTAIGTDVMYKRSKNGFDYLGSMVYKTESNSGFGLESTSFGGGRINATSNDYEIDYFITDHLGSTRVIVDNAGNIKEQNDYYPFGMRHENNLLMVSSNRWKFVGEELQVIGLIGDIDLGARNYDPFTGTFRTQDLLAEKKYALSSYVYAANNPLKYIDLLGLDSVQRIQAVELANQYVAENPGNSWQSGARGGPGQNVDCSGMVSNCIIAGEEPDPYVGRNGNGVSRIVQASEQVTNNNDIEAGNVVALDNSTTGTTNPMGHIGIITEVQVDANSNVTGYTIADSGGRPATGTSGPRYTNITIGGTAYWDSRVTGVYKWDTRPDVINGGTLSGATVIGPLIPLRQLSTSNLVIF